MSHQTKDEFQAGQPPVSPVPPPLMGVGLSVPLPANTFAVPPAVASVASVDSSALDSLLPRVDAVGGNSAREAAAREADALAWTFEDGNRVALELTTMRWALFEALSAEWGAASQVHALNGRKYLDALLMLFLATNHESAWLEPRTVPHPRRPEIPITLPPLMKDFDAFFRRVNDWANERIPFGRLEEAVEITARLIFLHTRHDVAVDSPSSGDSKKLALPLWWENVVADVCPQTNLSRHDVLWRLPFYAALAHCHVRLLRLGLKTYWVDERRKSRENTRRRLRRAMGGV